MGRSATSAPCACAGTSADGVPHHVCQRSGWSRVGWIGTSSGRGPRVARITPRLRLLHLRVLALRNIVTGYEPHQDAIQRLAGTPVTKLGHDEQRINWLARHYRRQISPELVPVCTLLPTVRTHRPASDADCKPALKTHANRTASKLWHPTGFRASATGSAECYASGSLYRSTALLRMDTSADLHPTASRLHDV